MTLNDRPASRPKPAAGQLGVDLEALEWQRSGSGDGSFEVAFVGGTGDAGQGDGSSAAPVARGPADRAAWVLLRVAGDPSGRVLVYDPIEWAAFLDGARKGEFDRRARATDSGASGLAPH